MLLYCGELVFEGGGGPLIDGCHPVGAVGAVGAAVVQILEGVGVVGQTVMQMFLHDCGM